ncbi:hypothetical protein EVAR_83302_1 [Eumeta japonica]|uniref:Uncharacterized protein n=1 Tax=Eumeta variegata TaxID=151549 RepID=A0A4C1VY96_EUMVA|nr:hypothetical protein EVAR_83302_1 [Eumeta japonica]
MQLFDIENTLSVSSAWRTIKITTMFRAEHCSNFNGLLSMARKYGLRTYHKTLDESMSIKPRTDCKFQIKLLHKLWWSKVFQAVPRYTGDGPHPPYHSATPGDGTETNRTLLMRHGKGYIYSKRRPHNPGRQRLSRFPLGSKGPKTTLVPAGGRKVSDNSGGSLPFLTPLPSINPPSITYPVPTQEAGNASVTECFFLRRCPNAETLSRHESPDCGAKRGITQAQ